MEYSLRKNKQLLSVISASLNSEKTIKKTIESVLNQTISNFEYIVIDGNSNDKTIAIVKSFEDKFTKKGISYKWISENDTGIYDAFNKGINLSKGKWISFLGSDDIYKDNAIELYYKNIVELKREVDFIHSEVKVGERKIIKGEWSWKIFKRDMNIAHVGAFHHKKYFEKYGLFDTSYRIVGDYELLLRARSNLKALKINEVTAIMGDEGISNKSIKEVFKEATRAKIETAKVSKINSQLDYYKWLLKYQIKKVLYALTR